MALLPLPILLIHGFDGTPADWTEDGFPLTLVKEGRFDPELIRLFYYGLNAEGNYNNRGDIRQVAARLMARPASRPEDLASQVGVLSRDSVAKGGPSKVTVVAHSMGGLVARYYLSRRTPDEFGTVYQGDVSRLITIGSPHLGIELADLIGLLSNHSLLWRVFRWLERLPLLNPRTTEQLQQADDAIRWWQQQARRNLVHPLETQETGRLDSPALRQVEPDSAFLRALNAPGAMPTDVLVDALYGDIRFTMEMTVGRLPIYRRSVLLGDLLVSVESASTVPNASVRSFSFPHEQRWTLSLVGEPAGLAANNAAYLPPSYHGNLRAHPGVQAQVLNILRR